MIKPLVTICLALLLSLSCILSLVCFVEAGVIYLKDGIAIGNARDIKMGDKYIFFTINGRPHKVKASYVKTISWIENEPKEPSKQQSQAVPKKVSKSPKASINPIASVPRSKAKADLKAKLATDYSGSYSTQNLLLKTGMRDYDTLSGLPANRINNQILRKLSGTYYPSFSTIWLLYKSEIKAYKELNE